MARIRTIKPSFFLSEEIAELKPLARLLFISLWTLADKVGRLEDRPRRIKVETLPHDKVDVDGLLDDLHHAGFIVRYSIDDVKYIQINNFTKHQRPHNKEPDSEIPEPAREKPGKVRAGTGKETAGCALREGNGEQEGKEYCSELDKPASEPTVPLLPVFEFPVSGDPKRPTWGLSAAKFAEYAAAFPGLDLNAELRKARQWCIDNPIKRKTARGLPAFLTRWLSKAQDRGTGPPARASPKTIDEIVDEIAASKVHA